MYGGNIIRETLTSMTLQEKENFPDITIDG
jgi:hypothetical protein